VRHATTRRRPQQLVITRLDRVIQYAAAFPFHH
jgi:hypothetical protein